tara:strand:+ start:23 stop:211 length:189 start_codon:yes stop_codon:yes gene_type:complete
MLHKISELCDRIDVIKNKADQLRTMKYGTPKADDSEIKAEIEDIQYMCRLIGADKEPYVKRD